MSLQKSGWLRLWPPALRREQPATRGIFYVVCAHLCCLCLCFLADGVLIYIACVSSQTVFYFPLIARLKKLLRCKQYRGMCQHEVNRPEFRSGTNLMTDVYDSPAWREFMGPPTARICRIALQFCIDAIPAFAAGTLSLKPAEFVNLSLPPAIRTKTENILLLMLLPASLKVGQKKYFDFAAEFELNYLAHTGIYCLIFSYCLIFPYCLNTCQMIFHY